MKPSPARSTSHLQPAARRPRRLNALFLLVLAVTACSVRPTGQTHQGSARWPPIVSHSALVCVAPAHPSATGGCVVQDAATGISLRVTNAYADVTSTVVQLQTANTAAYPLDISEPQLALPSGRPFQAAGSSSGEFSSITLYEPVPAEDMGPLVHFVATAHFMAPVYSGMSPSPPTAPPAPPWLNDLDRIAVSVPFALAPARSGGYTYHQSPIVKQGIGVQVQSLQFSPARTAFYGAAGGASIELLFSGLPADMELLSFLRVESQNSIAGGTEGNSGPGLVELDIPGMTVSTPAFTSLGPFIPRPEGRGMNGPSPADEQWWWYPLLSSSAPVQLHAVSAVPPSIVPAGTSSTVGEQVPSQSGVCEERPLHCMKPNERCGTTHQRHSRSPRLEPWGVVTILQKPPWPHDSQVLSVDPTVGVAGAVQLEVSYQGMGVPTGQPATVSISQIQLLTGGIEGNTGAPPTLPTYQITLPLP